MTKRECLLQSAHAPQTFDFLGEFGIRPAMVAAKAPELIEEAKTEDSRDAIAWQRNTRRTRIAMLTVLRERLPDTYLNAAAAMWQAYETESLRRDSVRGNAGTKIIEAIEAELGPISSQGHGELLEVVFKISANSPTCGLEFKIEIGADVDAVLHMLSVRSEMQECALQIYGVFFYKWAREQTTEFNPTTLPSITLITYSILRDLLLIVGEAEVRYGNERSEQLVSDFTNVWK